MNIINDYEENYKTGYVSLYRSIQNKGWYKKPKYVLLWVHILLKANHKESEFWFNGSNVKIKRGQFITGRKVLSYETGISETSIERILRTFENEQQIGQQKTNRSRLITVLRYDDYQKADSKTDNKRTTNGQQADTNNNDNNYNNKNIYKKFDHLVLTISDFEKLNVNYSVKQITEILNDIENFTGNKKYKSLYLTALKWLKKNNNEAETPRHYSN